MKGEPEILHEVPVDDVGSRDLPSDASSLILEGGYQQFSPRGTSELVGQLVENDLSPSDIKALRVESRLLGRFATGSGDVFKRATELQLQKTGEGEDKVKALEPEYVIVAAPLKQEFGEEASLEDTVRQLEAAQETMNQVEEPVDFTGQILIENRPCSVFCTVEDIRSFASEASKQGFHPGYSFNTAVENGREMLDSASSEDVELVRMSRLEGD
ncbi:hypothetical protein [Halosimplex pelagicum]|uniref:Uncharacterized protein n=1 Tax=Halosimplex pelagicum TaxID=869886 RepID=A0A7D5SXD8_9EURY|nr:hypothetical protein [Halosimplex pelagicum]QLH83827.1 hypothetical protein HZS54_20295 [Halosimplex pelagicum]